MKITYLVTIEDLYRGDTLDGHYHPLALAANRIHGDDTSEVRIADGQYYLLVTSAEDRITAWLLLPRSLKPQLEELKFGDRAVAEFSVTLSWKLDTRKYATEPAGSAAPPGSPATPPPTPTR